MPKPKKSVVKTVEMWNTAGPSKGFMLDGQGNPHPKIVSVPIEAHFTKTDAQGFSIFEKKGLLPAEKAKGATCPPDALEFLEEHRARERGMAKSVEEKIQDEVARRMGEAGLKPVAGKGKKK